MSTLSHHRDTQLTVSLPATVQGVKSTRRCLCLASSQRIPQSLLLEGRARLNDRTFPQASSASTTAKGEGPYDPLGTANYAPLPGVSVLLQAVGCRSEKHPVYLH